MFRVWPQAGILRLLSPRRPLLHPLHPHAHSKGHPAH